MESPGIKELKVSIIVPVYNTEDFFQKCIDSIVHQSHKNIEIILVDDGSTDNSLQLCTDIQKKDSRIVVINQKNRGGVCCKKQGH
jgi:glycosyltransferase involved in cell wall biosynthesis